MDFGPTFLLALQYMYNYYYIDITKEANPDMEVLNKLFAYNQGIVSEDDWQLQKHGTSLYLFQVTLVLLINADV